MKLERYNKQLLIFVGLFLITLVLRLPFRSQILYHWDSVNFALALEHYDVRLHQPHPPGTFIIYIVLGWLINAIVHDPNSSLVLLSIFSSGLSVVAAYILGERWFNRQAGLMFALLVLTSPLIWFHAEVALTYEVELLVVLILVLVFTKLPSGDKWVLFGSAFLLGLSGGVRLNTPVFLFPLWIVLIWKYPVREIIIAFLVLLLGVLIWFVPVLAISGGLGEYWAILQSWQFMIVTEETGSHFGMLMNGGRLAAFVFYGIGIGLIPVAYSIIAHRQKWIQRVKQDLRVRIILLWLLPALLFYLIVHLKQAGHVFTILPVLLILVVFSIEEIARSFPERESLIRRVSYVVIIVSNSLFFLLGPSTLLGGSRTILIPPTLAAISEYDEDINLRLGAIHEYFDPETTTVITGSRNFRIPDFYLRDYQYTSLSSHLGEEQIILSDGIRLLVLFDEDVAFKIPSQIPLRELRLSNDRRMQYLSWGADQRVQINAMDIEIHEK